MLCYAMLCYAMLCYTKAGVGWRAGAALRCPVGAALHVLKRLLSEWTASSRKTTHVH